MKPVADRSYGSLGDLLRGMVRWHGLAGRKGVIRVVLLLCCLEWTGVGVTLAVTAGEPRRVLILDSYGRDFSPWNVLTPSFKKELVARMPGSITFHETALQTEVEQSPEADLAFANYLASVYANSPPDLVVPTGAIAARFWWRHRARLFPATPVVIGGIERRVLEDLPLGPNDTAVVIQFEVGSDLILDLFPATTNISVVIGNSALERFWVAEVKKMWEPFTDRVQLEWFNELPFAEICRRASAMPPHSVLYHTLFVADGAGVAFEQTTALEQLCAVANVPVFGVFGEHLGYGIIGGRLFSGDAIGREAARVAARVLGGESAGTIPPVVFSASQPTFDWRELSRWGIDERQLPPGSVVRFRQVPAWERYRWYILGALGIILLQALTIVALLIHRARRRRAEGALQESRQFMEFATAAGELGLWVYNVGSDGIWVNPSMRWLFGWDENRPVTFGDLLGRVHPMDRSRAERLLGQSTRDGGTFEFESRLALPDGSTRWIVAKGMASRDSQSGPSRVQGVVFDVTAQHVAESTAQRHHNELLHLTRVHVLEQLSSALAHELNQPLGAILCNTEAAELLLDNRSPPWAEIRSILADIRADNQRASHVIESIRALIKPHEMKLDPISVHELIAECVALARANAMERNVAIHCQVLPATSPVLGDRVHLQQVLLNLLVNGMDAMGDTPSDRRQLLLQAQPDGKGAVTVSIQDNGCGIPSDQLERVFDLFHSTKSTGLGVGLSISRTIIESHGGRIWAENHAHGGTTVRFTLPVAA